MARYIIFSSHFIQLLLLFLLTHVLSLCSSSRSFPISPAQAYRKKLQDTEFSPNLSTSPLNYTRSGRRERLREDDDDHSLDNGHFVSNMIESNNEIQEPPVHISRPQRLRATTEAPVPMHRMNQPNSLRVFGRYSIAEEPIHHSAPTPPPPPPLQHHHTPFQPNISSFNEIRIPVFLPSISYENPSTGLASSPGPSLPPPPMPPPPPPYMANADSFSPYFPSTPLLYSNVPPTTPIPDSDPPGPINFDDESDDENSLTTKPADYERRPKKKRVVVRLKVASDDESLSREGDDNRLKKESDVERYKEYHKVMSSPPFHTLSSPSNDERVKALSSDHSMSCIVNEVSFASKEQIESTCRSHVDQIERLRNDCISQLKDFMEFNRPRRSQDRDRSNTRESNEHSVGGNNGPPSNEITGGKGFWWRSLFFSKASSP